MMMKKKVRPVEEKMGTAISMFVVFILWEYVTGLNLLTSLGENAGVLFLKVILFLGGFVFLYIGLMSYRKAVLARKERLRLKQYPPIKGTIVEVRQDVSVKADGYSLSQKVIRYYMIVKIYDPETLMPRLVKSEYYSEPLHKMLGDTTANVYQEPNGWKATVDDFILKKKRSEPDIKLENMVIYDVAASRDSRVWEIVGKAAVAAAIILLLVRFFCK